MKIKQQKSTWQQMARTWQRYIRPPSRPCPAQLKIWNEVIGKKFKKRKNLKALVLGSTPELRDLALKYGFNNTVVDVNPEMIKAMSKLMKAKNRKKEKIIASNWLKIKFPQNYFDLILGDAALNQILTKKESIRLLIKLKKLLKKDSLFLIREVVCLNKKPIIRGEKCWIYWFKKYKKGKIGVLDFFSMLKYQSDANKFSHSPSLIDGVPVYKKALSLYQKGKIARKFLDWYIKVFGNPFVHKFLLVFLKKDLEKLLKKYFKLLPIKQCRQYYHCRYMPCYLLRK